MGKFAVLVLALSLFAAPVMACMLPDSSLSDEERDCCQQMAGDCSQMPSSHSCCQMTVRDSDPYLVNSRLAISPPAHSALLDLPLFYASQQPEATAGQTVHSHAPPGSLAGFQSPLRI